jgi:DNA polymerase
MLVAEAPGREESDPTFFPPGTTKGIPLTGQAGDALQQLMYKKGFGNYKMFVTNVIKHRPPKNRPPTMTEKTTCSSFLFAQIHILKPSVIVAFGKHASETIRSIAGLPPLLDTEPHRGKHFQANIDKPIQVFNVYHPSYALLRNPARAGDLSSDLDEVLSWLKERR